MVKIEPRPPGPSGRFVYIAHERCSDSFGRFAVDHTTIPSLSG